VTALPGDPPGRPATPTDRVTLDLAADPAAVGRARRLVLQRCRDLGVSMDVREIAVVLTSELVTNAFVHGQSGARVALTAASDRLLVEVGDDNPRLPRVPDEDSQAFGGRGLAILNQLATDWGVRRNDRGKVVWFEIRYDL
jgi:anti-sigma regulatory factor (Ser/Thr protein kinase)